MSLERIRNPKEGPKQDSISEDPKEELEENPKEDSQEGPITEDP